MTEETQAQTEVQAQPQQAAETAAAPVAQPQQAQAPQKKNTCLLISLIFGAICFALYLLVVLVMGAGVGMIAGSANAEMLAAEEMAVLTSAGTMGIIVFLIPAVLSLIGLIFIARAWKHSNKKHALIAAILFTCAFVILGYWNLFTIPAAVLGYVGFYQVNKLNK